MTIRFACRCGKKFKAADEKIGKKVMCPSCGEAVRVPEKSESKADVELPVAASSAVTESKPDAASLAGSLQKQTGISSKGMQMDLANTEPEKVGSAGLKFDLKETLRDFALKFVPGIAVVTLLVIVTYWLSSNVMSAGNGRPPLAPVEGTVTLDGKPLAGATVMFRPKAADEDTAARMAASVGITDENGVYHLIYSRDAAGAAVGVHRVEIRHTNELGREIVDETYNMRSTLAAEVAEGKKNVFDFQVQQRTR